MTSDDRESLSHALTLLGELSRFAQDPMKCQDSINAHWHEVDGQRAGKAFDVIYRLMDEK